MIRPALTLVLAVVLHGGCGMANEHDASPSVAAVSPTPTPSATPPSAEPSERARSSAGATPVPNLQAGVASERGVFVGSWSSDPDEPPINVVHEWILHLETSDGTPVEGAIVTVNGDMPAHGHGMPTEPQVTADLGGGDYRVEGMSFQMGGYWVIDVTVTLGDETDLIHFGLEL